MQLIPNALAFTVVIECICLTGPGSLCFRSISNGSDSRLWKPEYTNIVTAQPRRSLFHLIAYLHQ